MAKAPDAFRTISEVSDALNTPAHVLRFWESKFAQIKPVKRAGGRRYYRPDDIALLAGIKHLLHEQGMTIKGAQKLLREQGVKHVAGLVASPIGTTAETESKETKAPAEKADDNIVSLSTKRDEIPTQEQPTAIIDTTKFVPADAPSDVPARWFGSDSNFCSDVVRQNAAKIAPLIERLQAVRAKMAP